MSKVQTVLMGYPWSMRPSYFSIGAHHVVLTEPIHVGRYYRDAGDALCKPRSRFRDLDVVEGEKRRRNGRKFDCEGCRRYNERFGLVPADAFGPVKVKWAS